MASLLKGKVITELGIRSPASRFFNVFIKQLHNLQNVAGRVHEGKVHQGDWHDIGSVKIWTITLDGKVHTIKETIEFIDEQNKSVTFIVFDGELSKRYKTIKINLQVIDNDKDDAGGVAKWTFDYEKLNETIAPPYHFLDYITEITQDVDAHLLKA